MKLEESARRIDELMVEGSLEQALKELEDLFDTDKELILDNPYFHLRKGQCHYLLDQEEEAVREFTIAYTLDGERIFEDEDPRYREFLEERIENSGQGNS